MTSTSEEVNVYFRLQEDHESARRCRATRARGQSGGIEITWISLCSFRGVVALAVDRLSCDFSSRRSFDWELCQDGLHDILRFELKPINIPDTLSLRPDYTGFGSKDLFFNIKRTFFDNVCVPLIQIGFGLWWQYALRDQVRQCRGSVNPE